MKIYATLPVAIVALLVTMPQALAQEESGDEIVPEELELTMTLLPRGAERAEDVTRSIPLPPAASRGVEASEKGKDTADAAREGERDFGLETAAEARERGQEFGEEMAERARENREDSGRGGPPDETPDRPDDLPEPPVPPRP